MLDKRTNTLLNFLVSSCENGSYVVIPTVDMINLYSKKYGVDAVVINQILTYLKERNYIDIKYGDENCYCIATLPKARIEHENTQKSQKNTKNLRKIAIFCVILSFLFAFLGAIFGVFVSKFVF